MSEVEDATSRQLKRRRVDLGLPRGNHATKINGFVSSNGAFQENVENNSEVLRNLLNLNRSSPNSTLAWGTADSCDSYKRHQPAEDHSSGQEEEEDEEEIVNSASRGSGEKLQTVDVECADVASRGGQSAAMPTAQTANWEHSNGSTSPMQETITESLKAKRARVENIITSMRHSPPAVSAQDMGGMEDSLRKPKRKQYQPQPQRWESGEEPPATIAAAPVKQARKQERHKLKGLLHHLQHQLDSLQEKYLTMFDEDEASLSDNSDDMDDLNEPIDTTSAIHKYDVNGVGGNAAPVRNSERKRRADGSSVLDQEASHILRQTLKEELTPLLLTAVDSVVNKLTTKSASKNAKSHTPNATPEINHPAKNSVLARHASPPPLISERKPTPPPTAVPASFFMRSFHTPLEQTEAMSLVVPSRKRVRSNDRSPLMSYHGSEVPMKPEPIIPVSLPTSVAIPNPSLHPTLAATFMTPPMTDPREHFESMRFSGSPLISSAHLSPLHYMSDHRSSPGDLSHISGESLGYSLVKPESRDTPPHQTHERPSSADLSDYSPVNGTSITATLTPTHLRKAKLMFFFTRYPSSALLRQHFPDVKFNRHNTSQIIKWFSNFREFYYIQMEKFSRQAVSDNVENSDDLQVTRESELFRALNLHYNKSNEFTVPESFIHVSTTTLREFFNAIKTGKDVEPSWKKTIYKVISKLDEPLPPFFKNPNCLELLPL